MFKTRIRKRIIFNEFLDEWLTIHKVNVKESTYVTYYNHCKNHIKPYFQKQYLQDINHNIIQQFIDYHLKYGNLRTQKELSVKTVKELINVLKLCLKYAMNEGYIQPFNLEFKLLNQNKAINMMNQNDYHNLVSYLKENESYFHIGILMMLSMGMRIGEVCALKNKNINLRKKEIYINSTLQRIQDFENNKTKIIITPVKTIHSQRIIPIPNSLVQYLKLKDDNYFFLTQSTRYIEPRSFRYKFKKIIKKLQIDEVTVHSLRHYFASQCIELGFDYNCLSEILGHSSPSTTMNLYVHCQDKYKQECMNKIHI